MNERVLARLKTALWVAPLTFVAILAPRSGAHTRSTDVTWMKDIAPIVTARCVSCHRPAGGAQPSLVAYRDAQTSARAIRAAVLENRMPPWPAARGFGDFANDRSLTMLEVELIAAWVDGNGPLGQTEMPPAPTTEPVSYIERVHAIEVPAGHPPKSVESFRLQTG